MEQILKYFPDLTDLQKQQFAQLQELYTDWNSKINIISRKDIDELYIRHVLHSLGIAKVIQFQKGTSVLDVGTGGGFPGIPLAILFPEVKFYLIDVIAKKIMVVNEVAQSIGLKNLKAEQKRAGIVQEKFDFIVSRAVTNMTDFVGWVKDKIKKEDRHLQFENGIFYLKGGDLAEELASFKKVQLFDLTDFFEEAFFETKKVVYLPL